MSALGTSLLLVALSAAPAAERKLPLSAKAPQIDGDLKEFKAAPRLSFSSPEVRAQVSKEGLHLGVTVVDPDVSMGDALSLSLFFPGAGVAALGHSFRFAEDGPRAGDAATAAPPFATKKVRSAAKKEDGRVYFEISIPPAAFPRFPATEPLLVELCLRYDDRSEPGAKAEATEACDKQVLLPEELRKQLKLKVPPTVAALEPREKAWLGFGTLHYPVWIQADGPLNASLLAALVGGESLTLEQARVAMPEELRLPDGRVLFPVFTGKDPQAVEGSCDADHEIRLGLYLLTKNTASRALEWPAATCALGRATSVVLDEEGALSIGYTSGAVTTFTWSTDHFERTEIGRK